MIKEYVSIKGNLNIKVIDKDSNVKQDIKVKNLVVATGKDHIADRMTSNVESVMSHMAVGSANVNPTVSDTALLGEIARVTLTSSTVTNNTIAYSATFPAGTATGTIAEAGIFNNPTANTGTMLCRTRFNEVNKAVDDIIVITWNVTIE